MPTSADDVAFLYRRAGFGCTTARVNELIGFSRAELVERLLNGTQVPLPAAPAFLADTRLETWQKAAELRKWWLDQCASTTAPLVEKMTLFWQGHFTSAFEKVYDEHYMWAMHAAQRQLGLTNVRTMAQNMAVQPAMLWYLDNEDNYARSPNQNFGRELLELFLLGVGNYTEQDVEVCTQRVDGPSPQS